MTFEQFFEAATGHAPYDYQRRLACGERNGRSEAEWLEDQFYVWVYQIAQSCAKPDKARGIAVLVESGPDIKERVDVKRRHF